MSASVDDVAIRWAVQCDAENLDDAQKSELDDWLSQDERHRGAFFRAQAGLALVDGMAGQGQAMLPLPASPLWRRLAVPAGLAACMAGALVASWIALSGEQYRTEIGEIRRIALSDGSVAMVNSGSDLEVRYEEGLRQLRLDEGEAWFKVARNKQRPFVVDADDVHVRATGTAFSVRRRKGAVEVLVTEGSVLVWRGEQARDATAVSAGNAVTISTTSTAVKARAAPITNRDPLAWREGGLSLNETTVLEAADEFNRYNRTTIEVVNPSVGRQLMAGYFYIDRPDEFAQAVADITGARVSKKDNKYVIE